MTPIAITFLTLSLVLVWGGFLASVMALSVRPERRGYPDGEDGDDEG